MVRPEPPLLMIPLPPALDVYSYDEDDMVLDPNLAEHLSHFGIDMLKMQKVRPLAASDSSHPCPPGPASPEAEAVHWSELPRLSRSPTHVGFL